MTACVVSDFSRTVRLAAVFAFAPTLLHAQSAGGLPPADGRELAQKVCATACHDATPLLMKRDGESGWRRNVERMVVQKGAHIFPDDLEILIRYLSTQLGPGTGPMRTPGPLPPGALAGGAVTAIDIRLPAGPGRELVEARCSACHDLGRVVSLRRTQTEWEGMTRNMIGRGSPATPAQVQRIIDYLTTHFAR